MRHWLLRRPADVWCVEWISYEGSRFSWQSSRIQYDTKRFPTPDILKTTQENRLVTDDYLSYVLLYEFKE